MNKKFLTLDAVKLKKNDYDDKYIVKKFNENGIIVIKNALNRKECNDYNFT